MMALDAPLMFFTAATIMSWNLFIKQSARYENALSFAVVFIGIHLQILIMGTTYFHASSLVHMWIRPFTGFWWTWLLATGVSMAGAMSVKLVGITSAMTTLYYMSLNLWNLARDKSVNTVSPFLLISSITPVKNAL